MGRRGQCCAPFQVRSYVNILRILLIALLAMPPLTLARDTHARHELLWESRTIRVYRIELGANDRSALQEHRHSVLSIPLTDSELLEAEGAAQGHGVVWSSRRGVYFARPKHSVFNPATTKIVQLEIEYPPTEKPLLPRFTTGLREQRFALPGFTLGKHTLLPDEKLDGMTGCNGVVIPTSTALLLDRRTGLVLQMNEGDTVPSGDLKNIGGFAVGLLSVCETPANVAKR
jgi:hypothetical protein